MTVTGSAVITDGYHDRIDISTTASSSSVPTPARTLGNVNNISRAKCAAAFRFSIRHHNGDVVIPPDNGDVTGLQSFTTRFVKYVAEGGNLRVYDTLI